MNGARPIGRTAFQLGFDASSTAALVTSRERSYAPRVDVDHGVSHYRYLVIRELQSKDFEGGP